MCLARLNQHQKSHFLISRVASSGELISSNCGSRCCFPTCRKLFVGLHSLTKTNIMLSIRGELNTYDLFKWPAPTAATHYYPVLYPSYLEPLVTLSALIDVGLDIDRGRIQVGVARGYHVEGLAVLNAAVRPFCHKFIPGSCPRKLHPLDLQKAPSEIRRDERGIPMMPSLNITHRFHGSELFNT